MDLKSLLYLTFVILKIFLVSCENRTRTTQFHILTNMNVTVDEYEKFPVEIMEDCVILCIETSSR